MERKRNLPVACLQCDQAEVLPMIEAVPIADFRTPNDHSALIKQCADQILE